MIGYRNNDRIIDYLNIKLHEQNLQYAVYPRRHEPLPYRNKPPSYRIKPPRMPDSTHLIFIPGTLFIPE